MEGSSFAVLQSKLNTLRSKYLMKMIHSNVVQQKHIRNQERYKQEMTRKWERSYERHLNARVENEKGRGKGKGKEMKVKEGERVRKRVENVRVDRHTVRESEVESLRERGGCRSLDKSSRVESMNRIHNMRVNTLLLTKEEDEREYSNHIMIQNLERFEKYQNNLSKSKHSVVALQEHQRRRDEIKQSNAILRQNQRNNLIDKICNRLVLHNDIEDQKKKLNLKQIKKAAHLAQLSKSNVLIRLKRDHEQNLSKYQKRQQLYAVKSLKALQLKESSLERMKERGEVMKVKEKRAKENKQNLDRARIQQGNSVIREHASMSVAGKEIKQKVEKYKQEKIMMDFLSQQHAHNYNQTLIH